MLVGVFGVVLRDVSAEFPDVSSMLDIDDAGLGGELASMFLGLITLLNALHGNELVVSSMQASNSPIFQYFRFLHNNYIATVSNAMPSGQEYRKRFLEEISEKHLDFQTFCQCRFWFRFGVPNIFPRFFPKKMPSFCPLGRQIITYTFA